MWNDAREFSIRQESHGAALSDARNRQWASKGRKIASVSVDQQRWGWACVDNGGWRKRALICRVIADQIIFIASIELVKSVVQAARGTGVHGGSVGRPLIWRRNWTGWQFPSIHLTCDMIQKRSAVVTSSIASSVADNHRPARPRENRVATRPPLCPGHRDFLSYLFSMMRVTGLWPSRMRMHRPLQAETPQIAVRFDGQSLDRVAIMYTGMASNVCFEMGISRVMLRLPCLWYHGVICIFQFYLASRLRKSVFFVL